MCKAPVDWQHANPSDDRNDADRTVAFGDRQGMGLAGFARAFGSQRARQPAHDWLHQLDQRPDRGNANRAGTDETHFRAPGRARDFGRGMSKVACERGVMRHAPAPANQRADEHRNSNPQTDEMPDPKERERKKEIVTANRAA